MKFLINDPQFFDPKYTDTDILKQMSVYFREENGMIFISEQKITLDEFDMNYLFLETPFGDLKLKYAYIGGEGCDFSLQTTESKLI
jgi:hypothetical protein